MNVEPGQVKSIFLHAVENCARGEWGAYLDQACGENAELRRRVLILLDAHETADSLIDLPEPTATLGDGSDDSGQPGTVIGPYKLLQPIGEGGMGTVYMAEQTQPVRRTVAAQAHQGRHGQPPGPRPLRGRAPGAGPDGPPQHRQGLRRRHHRRRAAPTS